MTAVATSLMLFHGCLELSGPAAYSRVGGPTGCAKELWRIISLMCLCSLLVGECKCLETDVPVAAHTSRHTEIQNWISRTAITHFTDLETLAGLATKSPAPSPDHLPIQITHLSLILRMPLRFLYSLEALQQYGPSSTEQESWTAQTWTRIGSTPHGKSGRHRDIQNLLRQ